MPEITLRDLCRWERTLALIPPAGVSVESALDRGVSWAVSVRAAPPHLPPLRGDELVVLPLRLLEQIEAGDTVTRDDLLAELARQPVAAILSEVGFTETPLDHLPVLTLPAPFPHDAEGTLNRMITEQRSELYRLGTELSRRLSRAVADPRGLEAVLLAAAELTGRGVLLEDAEGNPLAWAGSIRPRSGFQQLGQARTADPPLVSAIDEAGDEHLIVALPGNPSPGYLSLSGPPETLNERDRLILLQTAGTCGALLGQSARPAGQDRAGRERLVADLLLGRLASDAAAQARAQTLGFEPSAPLAVGMAEAQRESVARGLVLDTLGPAANLTPLPGLPGAIGFLLPAGAVKETVAALRRAAARQPEARVALSQPVRSAALAPQGLREARFTVTLQRSGALADAVVSCDSVEDLGLYGLLYHLWGHASVERFTTSLLGELAEYDQRRGTELLETLDAYLEHGGALAEAAAALGVHRNTLAYRLQRITELSGRDLADPRQRLLLQIALAARKLPPPLPNVTGR